MAAIKNLGVCFLSRKNIIGKLYNVMFFKSLTTKAVKHCKFYSLRIQERNLCYFSHVQRTGFRPWPLDASRNSNVLLSPRVLGCVSRANGFWDSVRQKQQQQKPQDPKQDSKESVPESDSQKRDDAIADDAKPKRADNEEASTAAAFSSGAGKSNKTGGDYSGKTMKYTFIAFGVLFSGLTGFLVIAWGSPATDAEGNPLTDEFLEMPFWKAYPLRFWRELHYYDKMIKEPSREKLLPDPLTEPYYQPPYTVVLELTGILVHPDWTYKTGWRFKKRPGVDYFLQQIGPPLYETVIYTSEQGFTAFPIIDTLDPNGYIMYRLFRDATRYMKGHHVKDLSCLNRDLSKVIFIDWNEKSFQMQPENALKLKKWNGNDDDRTLIDLAAFLRTIATNQVDDVRSVLAFYKQFDDPVEGFKFNQKRLQEEKQRSAGSHNLENSDRRSSWTSLLFKRWQT